MDDIIRPKKRSPLDVTTDGVSPAASPPLPRNSPVAPEPTFMTPEDAADKDIASAVTETGDPAPKFEANPPTGKKRRFGLHMPHGKKQWIIAIIVAVLLLGGGGAAGWWFFIRDTKKPAASTQTVKKEDPPKPTTEESKFSGLQVPIGTNLKPVTAVMIENSPDARPQAGLKDAGVVFEAVAEGGITRFIALFQDTQPDYVGPIRSVRPYYIDWALPFDASIAHVGGSPKGLSDIKSLNAKDLDQFANSGSYDRVTSRYAPHNVYTSIARLNNLEKSKGFTTANFTGFSRKKEAKSATPTAKTVDLTISSYYYNVHYDYDAATNSYSRSEGGAAHKDEKSGTQITPKVVVAIVMSRGIDSDGQHTDYTTVGSGKMFVFQDGLVQEGTWSKSSRGTQWAFTDANGKALAFNPGQTWFSMVDTSGSVVYKP
jgi:hypothetical protein